MKIDKKRTLRKYQCICGGFTLVELMVCIALISVLSVAVGLGIHGAYQRTGQAKVALNDLQPRSYLVERIAEKIQWATDIIFLTSDFIVFTHLNPSTGNPVDTGYDWDHINHDLYHSRNWEFPKIIQRGVHQFSLVPDITNQDGNNVVRGIELTIQIGTDQNDTLTRYIGLPNTPVAPGG